jgi:hypothetical protein
MDIFSAVSLAIFTAILGALSAYFVRRRFERIAATIKQFEFYHSDKMVEARAKAWDYLESEEYTKDPKPLDWFYSKEGIGKEGEYKAIVQVLYFWYLLSVLHEQGDIVPGLARKLLSYQYRHWKRALKPLLEATKQREDQPECLAIMDSGDKGGSMAWIEA